MPELSTIPSQRGELATESRWHRAFGAVVTAFATVTMWLILVLPADLRDVDPWLLVLIPAEGLVLLAVMVWAPQRITAQVVRWGGGILGVLLILRLFDLGFDAVFDRPLDPINDWVYLNAGAEVVSYEYGWPGVLAAVGALLAAALGVMVLLPRLLGRIAAGVTRHRDAARTILVVLTVLWLTAAALEWRTSPRTPVAAYAVAGGTVDRVGDAIAALVDRRRFDEEIAADTFAAVPPEDLLVGLRGKDVLLVFVESYGRAALEDAGISAGVDQVLDEGSSDLAAAGFASRSGFLTSPTFGAASWLAHASLQSGLWVDGHYRHNRLLLRERLTLTSAFDAAGWRTVTYSPAITKPWPDGQRFYGFDELVRGADLDYAGERFGFDSIPDQFTLARLQQRELSVPVADRAPVMAEVDLVSSHHPWTPVPRLVDWARATDPAAYSGQTAGQPSQREVFGDTGEVRTAYAAAIEYSLSAVLSFVREYGGDDLVVLMVGDHQPHSYVSGAGSDHDVPVSLISGDASVLAGIRGWGWESGLNPGVEAPVARMDGLRDRLFNTFSAPATGG